MGVSGIKPSFRVGTEAVRQAHGSRLAGLAGRRLTGFALVRFAEDGDWFADCPVVLDFGGVQVEVCQLWEVALLERRPAERGLAAGTVAVEFVFAGGSLPLSTTARSVFG